MSKLLIQFSSDSNPELLSVSFEHSLLGQSRYAVRGKSSGAHTAQGTFQWTSAVQALTIFLLHTAAACRRTDYSPLKLPIFEGNSSSLASALDYALGKQPSWLIDVFGVDKRQRSLARRLIKRSNPERKRKGPVQLSLNSHFLAPEEIEVRVGNNVVLNADYLEHLAEAITSAWKARYQRQLAPKQLYPGLQVVQVQDSAKNLQQAASPKSKVVLAPDLLARILKHEGSATLNDSSARNQARLKAKLRSLDQTPTVAKLFLQLKPLLEQIPEQNWMSALADTSWAKLQQVLAEDPAISCAVPWINASSLALFHYLKYFRRCNLDINFEYFYSIKLKRNLIQGSMHQLPDTCILGIGPAASLASSNQKCGYLPRMFMPCNTHRIVLSQDAAIHRRDINYGEYTFICEEPSTSVFYFEQLNRLGLINPRRVTVTHLEPEEVPHALQENNLDLRAIMFFPHYNLNEIFNNCSLVQTPQNQIDHQETVLFYHKAFASQKKRAVCLEHALRLAWMELAQNPALLEKVTQSMAADHKFNSFLSLFTGLDAMIKPTAVIPV